MSTYMPKAGDITRQWHIIDAEGKTLGAVAAKAAELLRGKHKVTFAPHADCGDHVIIINADKFILTGKKLDQKMYYHHTGYIGNMKTDHPNAVFVLTTMRFHFHLFCIALFRHVALSQWQLSLHSMMTWACVARSSMSITPSEV